MSDTASTRDPEQPGHSGRPSSEAGRRRGRMLIPGVVLGVILGIFAVLLLVTQCGSSADDVSQGDGSRTTAVSAAMDAGSPLRL